MLNVSSPLESSVPALYKVNSIMWSVAVETSVQEMLNDVCSIVSFNWCLAAVLLAQYLRTRSQQCHVFLRDALLVNYRMHIGPVGPKQQPLHTITVSHCALCSSCCCVKRDDGMLAWRYTILERTACSHTLCVAQ